jgi:hypothetical protein
MRILLDECVDEALRRLFVGHECQTCRFAGMSGLSNGRLVEAAESAGFDVLVTVDRKMSSQQNLRGRAIALLILYAKTTNFEDLAQLMPEVIERLPSIRPGEVMHIGPQ